uniref:hypothetical protein n=1 Tax=Trichocoleus desertorum TaxID=1481672 RepID=UPI0025B58F49|nr:hypothetical protein [Trichocoleus desertorum]
MKLPLEGVWGTQPSLSGGLGALAPKGSVLEHNRKDLIKRSPQTPIYPDQQYHRGIKEW